MSISDIRTKWFAILFIALLKELVDGDFMLGIFEFSMEILSLTLLSYLLGRLTNFILTKLNMNPWFREPSKENILDYEPIPITEQEVNRRREYSALNLAVGWALLFLIAELF